MVSRVTTEIWYTDTVIGNHDSLRGERGGPIIGKGALDLVCDTCPASAKASDSRAASGACSFIVLRDRR